MVFLNGSESRREILLHRTAEEIIRAVGRGEKFQNSCERAFRAGVVAFTSLVLGESKEPEPTMELEFLQEIMRMERRAYPRLPVRWEAYYAEIHAGTSELAFAQSLALDISGGGILLETYRPCPQETLIRLKFQIPIGDREELVVIGRIARSIHAGSARNHQVGVEFIDITPRQQESVIRFVTGKLDPGKVQA